MSIKGRAIAALKLLPSEALLERLTEQLDRDVKIWKIRVEADPAMADVAMEELMPSAREVVRVITTIRKQMDYSDELVTEFVHKLMSDER